MINIPAYKRFIKDDQIICLLCEKHQYIDGEELLARLGDRVFVDIKHTCRACEEAVRVKKYAVGVNNGSIDYPYEVYRDTYIEESFRNLIRYSDADKEQKEKLQTLYSDLKEFHSEKRYGVIPKLEEDKLVWLRKQNYYIKDFRNGIPELSKWRSLYDVYCDYSKVKYIIHLPIGRIATTTLENGIIHSLSGEISTNLYKKAFVVFKE
jgi:hypothetical protein